MPLQNRVTPAGEIVAIPQRGLFMGNRGLLHDQHRRIRRRFQGKRWIICVLEFKGRRRAPMTPGLYTELFFLDEATALAAGHRPCAECRRARYNEFRRSWAAAHGVPVPSSDQMDERLHAERTRPGPAVRPRDLPTGAMVSLDGEAWLVTGDGLRRWTPEGYAERRDPVDGDATLLTPPAMVEVLRAGYAPVVHPSGER